MGIEFKAENSSNTGYPATVYGAELGGKYGGDSGTGSGQTKYRVLDFTIDMTDPAAATDAEFVAIIPAGATIVSAEGKVKSTLSGGAGLDVGLVNPDGTSADPDALIDAATATGTAVGSYFVGNGAAIGTSVTADKQVTAATRTAGVVEVRITYIP
jgi:hypothetical protein